MQYAVETSSDAMMHTRVSQRLGSPLKSWQGEYTGIPQGDDISLLSFFKIRNFLFLNLNPG
jgi:hypothetical protein